MIVKKITKVLISVPALNSDLLQSRLDTAKELGADHTLLVTKDSNEAEIVHKVNNKSNNRYLRNRVRFNFNSYKQE